MRYSFFILFFIGQSLLAAEAGRLVLSGRGCSPAKNSDVTTSLSEQARSFEVPLSFKLEKKSDQTLQRQACNLALPIKIGKSEKIQILDIQQDLLLSHKHKTSVKAQLSMFLVGQKATKEFQAELKAEDTSESLQKLWNDDSGLLQSACGKDTILRANFSAQASGDSVASATSESLKFSIKVVNCN